MLRARAHPAPRLEAFDGLRACAALAVVAYHVARAAGLASGGALAPASELKAGVTIFFVISGFLLYLPYAQAIRDGDRLPDWRDFGRRRAIRIVPAYWVALTVVALGPFSAGVLNGNWWRFYGLWQIYRPDTTFGGVSVAWSLCVEVSFYAMLPLFAWGMARLAASNRADRARSQLRVIGALAAGCVLLRLGLASSLVDPVGSGAVLATSLPGLLDWFALGMGLAVLRSEWELGRQPLPGLEALARRPVSCWLIAGGLYCVGMPMQHGDTFLPLYGLGTHLAIGLAAAAFVLPAISVGGAPRRAGVHVRAGPMRLLMHPMMAWLGVISYGIYLWHEPFLNAIWGKQVAAAPASVTVVLGLLFVSLAGAVLLGAASWYLLERPAQRRGRGRRRPRPTESGRAQPESRLRRSLTGASWDTQKARRL